MAKAPAQVLMVEQGQVFKVTLAANPTTGYHWVLAAPPSAKVVKLVGNKYEPSGATDQEGRRLAGAGGHEVWTFQAVGQGVAHIRLHYLRPWEKGVAPVKRRYLMVQVK